VRENAAGVVYDPGGHIVAGMLFLPATAVAFIVLSHRLAGDPRWHPLAGNTLAAGVLGVVIVLATIVLVFSDAGPLHDVGGPVQRLTLLAVFFPCRLLLPARLLRIAGR
jgi:hypothetical protein